VKDDALRRAFAGTKPPAAVAAAGPESFLREQAMRSVAEAWLGSADSPDVVTVQPDPAVRSPAETAAQFLGEARTASLFGGRKVVVLRDADETVAAAKEGFAAWLASPAPSVVGVLLADELPADVVRAVEKAGVVVRCGGRGGEREAPDAFVRRRAADRGKRIGAADARLVAERVGDDLAALDSALEILCLHAGDAEAVTAADVDALYRSAREGTVWEFGDLLAEGEVAAALVEAARCFDEGVPEDFSGERVTFDERRIAARLLSSFVTSVGRAAALRRQLDAGVARGELQYAPPAFRPNIPWKAKERAARTAGRRRAEALDAMLIRAEETERAMKSGGADGRLAVARLATAVGMLR